MRIKKPGVPSTEAARLKALKRYDILDTLPENVYDNVTMIASQICGMPIALVSLIDEERQWFKSRQGLEASETPRDISFCGHAILEDQRVFEIKDSSADPRFADNPLVTGSPKVMFYAGAPLIAPGGLQIGTLCVIDHKPNKLNESQKTALRALADQVMALMEARLLAKQALMAERGRNEALNLAERANSAKSAFLANMSHEIRSPLGAIMGFADLLQGPEISQNEIHNYGAVISRNANHLLRVIDDILDLSKVEAGKMLVEEIEFSLVDLLADFSSLTSFKAREKGIAFEMTFASKVPETIISDPTRIRQILSNIVGNAVKFTERGKVTLEVDLSGDDLFFTVTDTGTGISSEQSAHLFQAFHQADVSTTRKFGGTGLGLMLTRRLTELMGGKFELERSAPGKGSVFRAFISISYPKKFKFVDGEAKSSTTEKPRGAKDDLTGLRVLLIEDSPDNQVLINLILSKLGAIVDIANDGLDGVHLALKSPHDVVLCDVQMPRMDGYATVKELRSKGYKVPIIALTAHAMKEERDRALASGFADYLTKPIQRDVLSSTLLRYKGQSGDRP